MIQAEIPELNWPSDIRDLSGYINSTEQPPTLAILDFIEFCYQNVAKPIQEDFHSFFGHYHLAFDSAEGQRDFRQKIERILARNGLAYELQENRQIIRLAPPILRESLQAGVFQTGDAHLDSLLEAARTKYLDPNLSTRRESLEKLWDAWERLKTIEDPSDKRRSVTILLDKAATEPNFRERLEGEAKELTSIGNSFMIRHTETDKIPISSSEQVDYFFQRLFALIYLLLQYL
jgi:23S rRNA A2030 N6-methylase RlmJ